MGAGRKEMVRYTNLISPKTAHTCTPWIRFSQYHNTADADNLTVATARGTLATPVTVQASSIASQR